MKAFLLALGIFLGMLLMTKCKVLKLNLNSPKDVCRLFPNNAILRKPGSCTETIKCQNGKSMPHSVTCINNQIVQLDKMTCANDNKKSPDKYCQIACKIASPKWIEDTKNCREWHECDRAKYVKSGVCPVGQIFNQNEQSCDYNDGKCDKQYDICNVAKTNQEFWDEDNCHKYYYCSSKRELKEKPCPIANYYDVRSGECIKKAKVDCYKHPLPHDVCGNQKLAIRNRFVNDQATCRGYFYCKDLGKNQTSTLSWNYEPDVNPDWGQCPIGYFFDENSEYCRDQNDIKCDEDRCDSRNSGVVLSEKPGCQHYLVCKDGYTDGEFQCPDNKYFDPINEKCVENVISYPICA
ncbi:peritrophin-48 [Calliphora vicina]|uniref:peritrophin-48 n=1 Tax=Calliphora vicina TaxID=7373 RepID=UPI00325B73C8